MREAVRVRAGLEQACLLFLRAEAGFLGLRNRIVSSAAAPDTWAVSGVITATQDLAAQWALCAMVEEGDAKAMLQGASCEIGVPVKER